MKIDLGGAEFKNVIVYPISECYGHEFLKKNTFCQTWRVANRKGGLFQKDCFQGKLIRWRGYKRERGLKGGTGDFKLSQHVSKQMAIAQKLRIGGGGGGGQKYTFSESSLSSLSKKFKMGSIGMPSKILPQMNPQIWNSCMTL